MQLRELREYAECRGWTIVEEYIDAGVSGAMAEFERALIQERVRAGLRNAAKGKHIGR